MATRLIPAWLAMFAAGSFAQPFPGAPVFVRNLAGLEIRALVTAHGGSIVVGGVAKAAGLPVTPNAIQTELNPSICGVIPGPGLVPNPCGDAYFARFDRNGSLVYGTYLGGTGQDELADLAVRPNGDLYILGMSRSPEISAGRGPFVLQLRGGGAIGFTRYLSSDPDVTPATIAASSNAVYVAGHASGGDGFLTKLDADSGAVLAATTFGGSDFETVTGLALDPAGNAYVSGVSRSPASGRAGMFVFRIAAAGDRVLASTAVDGGPFESAGRIAVAPNGDVLLASSAGRLVRLPADLSAPIFSTVFDIYTNVAAILPQADGSTILFGNTQSNFFPVTSDAVERCPAPAYVARLAADGSRFLYASFLTLPNGERSLLHAALTDTTIALAGATSIASVGQSATAPPPRLCAVNSASFGNFLTYGGEYVTIFGGGLNPRQVLVNGTPADLVYVSPTQVNILVPPLAPSKTLHIEVDGSGAIDAPAVAQAPGLFRIYGTSFAAALDDDGSVNGPDHPARRGGGLTLFGTGFGPAPQVRIYLNQVEAPVRSVLVDGGLVRIEVTIPDVPPGRYPVFFQVESGFMSGFVEVSIG